MYTKSVRYYMYAKIEDTHTMVEINEETFFYVIGLEDRGYSFLNVERGDNERLNLFIDNWGKAPDINTLTPMHDVYTYQASIFHHPV